MITLKIRNKNTASGLMGILFGQNDSQFLRDNPTNGSYPAGTVVTISNIPQMAARMAKSTSDADMMRTARDEGRLTGTAGTAVGSALDNRTASAVSTVDSVVRSVFGGGADAPTGGKTFVEQYRTELIIGGLALAYFAFSGK